MRCGRRPHPAAGRAGHGGSDPRCRSRNSSSGSPTRPETRSRPPRGPRPPPGAPEHRRSRASTRGVPWARTAAIAVPHPTPKSRATAATDAPSWPTRRHTSARARSVNDARGTISGEVSVQVLVEHSCCGHRHTRLTHTRVTGRPAVGGPGSSRAGDRAALPPPRTRGNRPDPRSSRWPARARRRARTPPARRTPANPTSPLQHYALVPPGASISVSLTPRSMRPQAVLRPRLKIVFYNGSPRSETKSQ